MSNFGCVVPLLANAGYAVWNWFGIVPVGRAKASCVKAPAEILYDHRSFGAAACVPFT